MLGGMDTTGSFPNTIVRCDPGAEKEVLAFAAQAWPEAERAGYWKAIGELVRARQAGQVVLLGAREGDRLLAAQLGQSLPGRAAVVWPPQFCAMDSDERERLTGRIFPRLIEELAATGAHVAQALLARGDEDGGKIFGIGGFTHAADLLYLAAEVPSAAEERLPLPFEIETFTPAAEQRLGQLIDRTYVGSLDCPRIDGLRKTADVIAGYQGVGQFHPELWLIARHGGVDVGCLLVNRHPDVGHAEIVYVALVPEVRGRGWGLALIRQAFALARATNSQRVVLAVDAANEPAIRHYLVAGFCEFDRRAVWVKALV